MRQFIAARNLIACSSLKGIQVYVKGIATAFNFDLFIRDNDGEKLNKIEEVRLKGSSSMISGIEGLAMSFEILPNLKELSLHITGQEEFADSFVQRFFNVLSLMDELSP